MRHSTTSSSILMRHLNLTLGLCAAAVLSACGGSADAPQPEQRAALLATGATVLQLGGDTLPADAAKQFALPAFHVAPVLLDTPDDATQVQAMARSGAQQQVHSQSVPAQWRRMSSRRLSVQALQARRLGGMVPIDSDSAAADSSGDSATPFAGTSVVSTYTPAQVRAAYGLPALPALGATLSAEQAALLGAGQTIYIVDAQHNPNTVAELAAFNTKFGLPACAVKVVAAGATLPLAGASSSSCELSVVYSTAAGAMTSTVPAYDSGWATEITLDVQWAHATAPLARIVLIEAADASYNNLLGAVKLANAMGPGVVSMSFGGSEGNWTASTDSAFSATNMSYLAATGDNGAAVSWPAVSPRVLAVGGTTLTYAAGATRSEVAWSGTGGGVSQYTATPSYQNNTVPGMGTPLRRTVADVAFNADPTTGQYVAVMNASGTGVNWISAGGTSLSTPQWAGLIAVANANRALGGRAVLGAPHAVLYGKVGAVPGIYAGAFADVVRGSHGSCAACTAQVGYDQLTGLGTPNAASLLSVLSGDAGSPAPVVTATSIKGQVGQALSFTVSVTSANAVSYALSGAPAGMTIAGTGAVTWAVPVAGNYAVTVLATDSKTGQVGKGVYSIAIAAPTAPVLTAATISGKTGTALSFTVPVTSANPVAWTLSGAPAGMSISSAGVVGWAQPVAGTYAVTVGATDSKNGLAAQTLYTVRIVAATVSFGPVITAPALTGRAGQALMGSIGIANPAGGSMSVSITGAPMGMMFWVSGMNVIPYWPTPVAGSYQLKITVTDSLGASAQATLGVTINPK